MPSSFDLGLSILITEKATTFTWLTLKIWDVWRVVEIKLSLQAESIKAIKEHFPSQDLLMRESNGEQEHLMKYHGAVADDGVKLKL